MKRMVYDLLSLGPLALEEYQQREYSIDPRVPPRELITELANPKKAQNLLRMLSLRGEPGPRVLRRYTIVHWCLIHEPALCEVLLAAVLDGDSSDEWLTKNVLRPYGSLLAKLCSSEEDYRRSKGTGALEISFEGLFFVGTLLQQLFLAARKVSPLARYYKEGELECRHVLRDFVMTLAYHAQEMYCSFKAILSEIIRHPHRHVRTHQHRDMVRFVMEDQLTAINEAMKTLFLDKHFYPFGHGYGVKLLKLEELPEGSQTFVDDLLSPPLKPRRAKKQTLDTLLFDQQGKLNPEVIPTLVQIRLGDETMRASFDDSLRSNRGSRSQECIEDI